MKLTRSNFELFAAKNYDNPHCESDEEFKEDLLHFKYLKRLVSQYIAHGKLSERLILNHIVIIHNMFGVPTGTEMIMHKMKGCESIIQPFLEVLNALPINTINNIAQNDPIVVESIRKMLAK